MSIYNNYNYTKLPDEIQSRKDLSANSKLIYSDLAFKMQLSFSNGKNFYDKQHGFYVVYKVVDLAEKAGCSKNAVLRALKLLESKDLIRRIRLMHFTRIFMPRLTKFHNEDYQSSEMKPVKRTNNLKQRTTNNTSNTINTENSRNSDKAILRPKVNKSVKVKHKPKVVSQWNHDENNDIRTEILNQRLGLPKEAARELTTDVGSDYYDYGHVMISAKRQAKNATINYTKGFYNYKGFTNKLRIKRAFRFEDNGFFKGDCHHVTTYKTPYELQENKKYTPRFGSLANQIRRGLWKAIHKITRPSKKYKTIAKARMAYFATAMKRYFIQTGISYMHKFGRVGFPPSKLDQNLPHIPIFKL